MTMMRAVAALALAALADAQMNPPLPKCQMGLIWPNATETLPMVAGLSGEQCAEIALNNSQWASRVNASCTEKAECDVIAYSYCEVSNQCGCLAGNDYCLLWSDIGKGDDLCAADPCFCSDMVQAPAHGVPKPPDVCNEHFYVCDAATATCNHTEAKKGTPPPPNSYNDTASCEKACVAPPPPPLAQNPCIRFGHTIPVADHVDAMITQDDASPPINHTWNNFKFADFSDWVNVFKPGTGTITIWENTGGKRGAQLYKVDKIPLTPGPLMVVIKVAQAQAFNASGPSVFWPPRDPDNIETIAASYVQPGDSAKVRLFNLSPDTKVAGMSSSANGTKALATNVE